MNDVSQRYRRLAGSITTKIEGVPEDRWADPSPCAGWTARDVVSHLVDVHGMFFGLVGRSLEPGPDVETDPLGAWTSARDQMQAGLDDPARAGEEFDGISGRSTFAAAVDRFVCFDLNIHGWDLARATGQSTDLAPELATELLASARMFIQPAFRGDDGVMPFGAEQEAPANATEADKLAAFLGRKI